MRNIRRVFYYGYHNDDPTQMFQSSLPIGRVLEDPPGELPVLLAYKLNGEFLSGKRGGPVRMLVPEAYGFKSVKWLQRVVLTNHYAANDTYHDGQQRPRQPDEDLRALRARPATELPPDAPIRGHGHRPGRRVRPGARGDLPDVRGGGRCGPPRTATGERPRCSGDLTTSTR